MPLEASPRNLCGHVVHELGSRIVRGEVSPGETLPHENALCQELGVSRTVVREAVKTLAAKGLVEPRPKRGTVVQPRDNWNVLDRDVLEWNARSDRPEAFLRHLIELRQAVEPAAASLAARRADEAGVARIEQACREMHDSVNDSDAFAQADLAFHLAILDAAGNPFFAPVANVIRSAMHSSLRVTNRSASENRASIPLHQAVFRSIRRGNAVRAESAMKKLLADASARIERHLARRSNG